VLRLLVGVATRFPTQTPTRAGGGACEIEIRFENINFDLTSKRTMSTIEIKTELLQMIEKENDIGVLQAILTILQKTSLDPILREKLTSRALRSEEDIKSGSVFGKEEVIRRTTR
jgi:hypothetical protein